MCIKRKSGKKQLFLQKTLTVYMFVIAGGEYDAITCMSLVFTIAQNTNTCRPYIYILKAKRA
jgi:hypothetical protein